MSIHTVFQLDYKEVERDSVKAPIKAMEAEPRAYRDDGSPPFELPGVVFKHPSGNHFWVDLEDLEGLVKIVKQSLGIK